MKKRLTAYMLACLMILLVGCSSNTVKEAAKNETNTETSFPAGNTETQSQEETSTEQESAVIQEKTPNTADESRKVDESKAISNVQSKPAEEKSSEKPKAEPSKRTNTPTVSEKHTEQSKEPTSATPKPTEKPKEPKPTESPKQTFDVSEYVSYAKSYQEKLTSKTNEIPIWERQWLTIEEASEYSGIARRKLRELSNTSGCPFAIWMGNKIHIIREKLDRYTETHNRI